MAVSIQAIELRPPHGCGTIGRSFREARAKAGLPEDPVLYCCRHDYGTRILTNTGNLAPVMKTMGRKDVRAAMQYQGPELEIVRATLNKEQKWPNT